MITSMRRKIFTEDRKPERLDKDLYDRIHGRDYNQKSKIYQPHEHKNTLQKYRTKSKSNKPTHQKRKKENTKNKQNFPKIYKYKREKKAEGNSRIFYCHGQRESQRSKNSFITNDNKISSIFKEKTSNNENNQKYSRYKRNKRYVAIQESVSPSENIHNIHRL